MLCVETSSYFVVVNGNLYGFFPGKCGVRQRDPLFPYLFLICRSISPVCWEWPPNNQLFTTTQSVPFIAFVILHLLMTFSYYVMGIALLFGILLSNFMLLAGFQGCILMQGNPLSILVVLVAA
jgi:hypothetical protein